MSAGRDRPEEPVRLVVRACGEEQRVRVAVRAGVPELERPQAVDHELSACGGVPQRAAMLEAGGSLLVGVDLSVAEVADEQVAGKAIERSGGHCEPPRSVELTVLRDARKQVAVEVVGVDEASTLAGDLVRRLGVLLRVRDEDTRTDR